MSEYRPTDDRCIDGYVRQIRDPPGVIPAMTPESELLAELLPSPTDHPVLSFDDLRSAAESLVAHGRRADALRLVTEGMDSLGDHRGYLLLAQLHLDAGTRDGAEEALTLLKFRHRCCPCDLHVIALLRRALRALERYGELSMLDRTVSWMSATFVPPRTEAPRS